MNPYVTSIRPLENYQLEIEFDNGETRIFDATPYVNSGVFSALRNPEVFRTARVVAGSVEWLGQIDLSYNTLYCESKPHQTDAIAPVR